MKPLRSAAAILVAAAAVWVVATSFAAGQSGKPEPKPKPPAQQTQQSQETASPDEASQDVPQEPPPVQRPKTDYMSTFMSRSTSPLGLKADAASAMLLQAPTKWAIRAGTKHILW